MKYLKMYENFDGINRICQKYRIENCTINKDGSVDVDGEVDISSYELKEMPLKFNKVNRYFNCSKNQLTNLLRGPIIMYGGNYICDRNKLINVHGFPEHFAENFVFTDHNPVYEITILVSGLRRCKFIKWLNEYDVIRDGNKIVEMRLEEAYYMTMKEELSQELRQFKNYTLI